MPRVTSLTQMMQLPMPTASRADETSDVSKRNVVELEEDNSRLLSLSTRDKCTVFCFKVNICPADDRSKVNFRETSSFFFILCSEVGILAHRASMIDNGVKLFLFLDQFAACYANCRICSVTAPLIAP